MQKLKIHFLFILIITFSFVGFSQKNKEIIITNTLSIDRSFETIELSKELLGLKSSDKLEEYGIKEIGTNTFLVSQCIDENSDGVFDLLLFQPQIPASKSKKFEIARLDKSSKKEIINYCYSRFVPERTDDYAWENNKVAFRTYGPVAQKMVEDNIKGGTLTSGIDGWLKRVDYPIINKWYEKHTKGTGTYHEDTGEGLDNYHVGDSRGIGGIAVKIDSTYYTSKNFTSWKTISVGPIRTSFILVYEDWDANGKLISETKHISLDYGSYLSKFEIEIKGTKTVSAGLTLHDNKGITNTNNIEGWISYWETLQDSEIGTGIVTPKTTFKSTKKYETTKTDLSNLFINLKVNDGKVVYYTGFGWKKEVLFKHKNNGINT